MVSRTPVVQRRLLCCFIMLRPRHKHKLALPCAWLRRAEGGLLMSCLFVTLFIHSNLRLAVLCRTHRHGLKHMGMIPLIMCICTLYSWAEMLVATCYRYVSCGIDTVSKGKMCTLRRTYLRTRRLVEFLQFSSVCCTKSCLFLATNVSLALHRCSSV